LNRIITIHRKDDCIVTFNIEILNQICRHVRLIHNDLPIVIKCNPSTETFNQKHEGGVVMPTDVFIHLTFVDSISGQVISEHFGIFATLPVKKLIAVQSLFDIA
jgi:hypothetical protein